MQVQSKENVQKELNDLKSMIESVELQYNSGSGEASVISSAYYRNYVIQIAQVDKDEDDMDDSTASTVAATSAATDSAVSRRSLTPTKRPHVVDLASSESQNNKTDKLSEPDSKRRKNLYSDKLEGERLNQMWCNRHFVVSKLEGHNDVICSLDCNQDLLLTGSRDTSVKVWSLRTFEMLHHMGGHTSVVTCVKLISPSAGRLVKVVCSSEIHRV